MKKTIVLIAGFALLAALAALRTSPPSAVILSNKKPPTLIPPTVAAPSAVRYEAEAMVYTDGDDWIRFSRGVPAEVVERGGGVVERIGADGVVERYEPVSEGVEQSFLIPQRPEADYTVEAALESNLPARRIEDGVQFGERLVYRKAVAVDAAGARLPLAIEYAAGRVRMAIPASWLATAVFPVILDPLIGLANPVEGGTASPNSSQSGPVYLHNGLTYNAGLDRWLEAHRRCHVRRRLQVEQALDNLDVVRPFWIRNHDAFQTRQFLDRRLVERCVVRRLGGSDVLGRDFP